MEDDPFEARQEYLIKTFMNKGEGESQSKPKIDHVEVVEQTLVKDRDYVLEMLKGASHSSIYIEGMSS